MQLPPAAISPPTERIAALGGAGVSDARVLRSASARWSSSGGSSASLWTRFTRGEAWQTNLSPPPSVASTTIMPEQTTRCAAAICPSVHRFELAFAESKVDFTRCEIDLYDKPDWYAPR
ncbi:hypothetical protein DFH09DRAFT_1305157 [Mycena vulgaris]|nr:hypothetical protein DFH09DRAFT_1305157 [Mycena vulgaris]